MKKIVVTLLVLLAVALVCVITCPDKQAHEEALEDVIKEALELHSEALGENVDPESYEVEDFLFSILDVLLAEGLGRNLLEENLKVDNWFVFSMGTVTYEEETKTVSFGILNHVFTPKAEEILQIIEPEVEAILQVIKEL